MMNPPPTMEQAKRDCMKISGVSNVAYDALAILVNKLQGIAAMEEYKVDAREAEDEQFLQLLDELERRACQDIASLKSVVVRQLSTG